MSETPAAIRVMWFQISFATLAVTLVGWFWQPALLIQMLVVILVCLALLKVCARSLDITRTFPELLKLPLLSRILTRG